MQRIEVKNFGPLKDINLEIKDYMVFIGPQASGKSTLAKLIYFFWKIEDKFRDETIPSYAISKVLGTSPEHEDYIENWKDDFRKMFSDIFPTYRTGEIIFSYTDINEITFNVSKYVERVSDDILLSQGIYKGITKVDSQLEQLPNLADFYHNQKGLFNGLLELLSNDFFSDNKNISSRPSTMLREFIPAGRSILSILSNSFTFLDNNNLDYFTENFIRFTNKVRKFLNSPDYDFLYGRKTSSYFPVNDIISLTNQLSLNILKGDFLIGEKGDGIVHYNNDFNFFIPIKNTSSGQQESAWLINSIRYILFDSNSTSHDIIIEEPEANLFPDAQRDITKLITLLSVEQKNKTRLIITTHSPYVLATLNNSIKAFTTAQIENKSEEVEKILSKEFWINPENLFVGFMNKNEGDDYFGIKDIYDGEIGLISHQVLDQVSDEIMKQFDELLDIQYSE